MTFTTRLPRYVVEGIAHDAVFFRTLLAAVSAHPDQALLHLGLVPSAAMFVTESYDRLLPAVPELRRLISTDNLALIRRSRHSAKLLLSKVRDVTEIAASLAQIARDQRCRFLRVHDARSFRWLRRRFQPDMGIFQYDGEIFSTTHAIVFGFGDRDDLSTKGFEVGHALGRYISTISASLGASMEVEMSGSAPACSRVDMRDVKFEALYRRGPLGELGLGFAAACSLVLGTVTMTNRVMRAVGNVRGVGFFKQKFLAAYHAQQSLHLIQDALRSESALPVGAARVLAHALADPFSRWLRNRKDLRDTLVHYQPRTMDRADPMSTLEDLLATRLGRRQWLDVERELDGYLGFLGVLLTKGFNLTSNTFWHGVVGNHGSP